MNIAQISVATAALIMSSGAAQADAGKSGKSSSGDLQSALKQMMAPAMPPGQMSRPADPDMGDDRASAKAILVVCSKDTPAAQRSAICPRVPVSPQ
ncbi:MAG TPA: hypothetical protein VM265_07445 [Sphingomicrobium sp.]|nr:hypothetical protein [Sphingomicrobium sp.]